jgi:hypothetical protein
MIRPSIFDTEKEFEEFSRWSLHKRLEFLKKRLGIKHLVGDDMDEE